MVTIDNQTTRNMYISDDFDHTQKWTTGFDFTDENAGTLDLSELNLEVDIANIDQYPNQEYALLRKNGLGTCDNVTHKHKIHCMTAKQDRSPNSGLIEYKDFCRYLTRRELELGQTLPSGYCDNLSFLQAQDVIGNCWTVDIIKHIFSHIPNIKEL